MAAEDKSAKTKASEPKQEGGLLFGMEAFVEGLAEAVREHFKRVAKLEDTKERIEPLVIAVMGQWGSGKSSVLNRIRSLLKGDLPEGVGQGRPALAVIRSGLTYIESWLPGFEDYYQPSPVLTVPVFFNPWRYEQEAHLIVPLLKTTELTLSKLGHTWGGTHPGSRRVLARAARDVRDAAWAIASGLSFEVSLPGLAKAKFASGTTLKNLRERILNRDPSGSSPLGERYESIYYDILTHLGRITRPDDKARLNLVFIVDDLDRCLPEKAVQMLEAIKLFLDVPRCAFVLGLDEEVVERGIAHRYRDYNYHADSRYDAVAYAFNADSFKQYQAMREGSLTAPITGHEYLEKIVHLPFRLPVNTAGQAAEFLTKRYPELFDPDKVDEQDRLVDPGTAEDLKALFLAAVPNVPRKLVRAAESLRLWLRVTELRELRQGGHVTELLVAAFVILQQFAPEIYRIGRRYYPFLRTLHEWYEKDWRSEEMLEKQVLLAKSDEMDNPYVWRTYEQPLARSVKEALHSRSEFHPYGLFEAELPPLEFDQVQAIYELRVPEAALPRPREPVKSAEEREVARKVTVSRPHARREEPPREEAREEEKKRFRPPNPEDFFGQLLDKRPDVRGNAIAQQRDALEGRILADPTFDDLLRRVLDQDQDEDLVLSVMADLSPYLSRAQLSQVLGQRFGGVEPLIHKVTEPEREPAQRSGAARLLGTVLDDEAFKLLLEIGGEQEPEAALEWLPVLYPFLAPAWARQLAETWYTTDVLTGSMQSSTLDNRRRRAAGLLLGATGWLPEDLDMFLPVQDQPFDYGHGDRQEKGKQLWYDFWIGKYPVTNAQYRRFVEDGGYDPDKGADFWDEEGRAWLEKNEVSVPRLWDDPQWNNPLCPVVGVSWHEARAYARWLAPWVAADPKRYGVEPPPIGSRHQVRLPTEEEWERAARGTDGRAYPWGSEFETGRANTDEGGAGATTAVATFPGGESPVGAWDMSGNVWEWTGSLHSEGEPPRVVRGGSWSDDRDVARSALRNDRYLPEYRDYSLGFRLVVSIAPPVPAGISRAPRTRDGAVTDSQPGPLPVASATWVAGQIPKWPRALHWHGAGPFVGCPGIVH